MNIERAHVCDTKIQFKCRWCGRPVTKSMKHLELIMYSRITTGKAKVRVCSRCESYAIEFLEKAKSPNVTAKDFQDFMWKEYPGIAKKWWLDGNKKGTPNG